MERAVSGGSRARLPLSNNPGKLSSLGSLSSTAVVHAPGSRVLEPGWELDRGCVGREGLAAALPVPRGGQ